MPTTLTVTPSEKRAERVLKEKLLQSEKPVLMERSALSLPHFLEEYNRYQRSAISRGFQVHLISHLLPQISLRYFESVKPWRSTAKLFLEGIRGLKRCGVSPEALAIELAEAGSLKEYDLQKVYARYEEAKRDHGWVDEEDLLWTTLSVPQHIKRVVIDGFVEKEWVRQWAKKLAKENPHVTIKWQSPRSVNPQTLPLEFGSFSSVYQERDYIAEEILRLHRDGVPLSSIGVLYRSGDLQFYPLISYLQELGIKPEEGLIETRKTIYALQQKLRELKTPQTTCTFRAFANSLSPLETSESWQETIEKEKFYHTLTENTEASGAAWLERTRELLEETRMQTPIPQALTGLQWIDPKDADTPTLSHLFVPLCLEGIWPRNTDGNVFFQDRRYYRSKFLKQLEDCFPDATQMWEEEHQNFWQQIAPTEQNTLLSFPRTDAEGKEGIASSFLLPFLPQFQPITRQAPLWIKRQDDPPFATVTTQLTIEEERLKHTLTTQKYHAILNPNPWREKFRNHIFSASQLERYAACPFQYFSERVLKIPSPKDRLPDVDYNDRGTLFHQAMETLLTEEKSITETLKEKVREHVELSFARFQKELQYANTLLLQQLKEKTVAQILQLIDTELAEQKECSKPLIPRYFEWAFGETKADAFCIDAETEIPIYLGGRIDRIDTDRAEESFLVLDYKTGSRLKSTSSDLQAGLALQLPLYIAAVQQKLLPGANGIGGLLISTKSGKREQGLVLKSANKQSFLLHNRSGALKESEELQKALETALGFVREYVKKIRGGFFAPDPKNCTTTCDYKEICRYAHKPVE